MKTAEPDPGPGSVADVVCETGLPAGLAPLAQDAFDNATLQGQLLNAKGMVVGVRTPAGYYVQGFGIADASDGTPMPGDAVFEVGSVQKPFYWLLLHQLADQGVLAMSDPIAQYTSDPPLGDATILQLTQHSTGLLEFGDTDYLNQAFEDFAHEWSYEELFAVIAADGNVWSQTPFTAGADYHYTAFGPMVAAKVVEEATGSDTRKVMRDNVLDPLKLTNTSFVHYEQEPPAITPGYYGEVNPNPSEPFSHTGEEMTLTNDPANNAAISSGTGGLLYSNACDLLKYSQAVFTGSLLSEASFDRVINKTIPMFDVAVPNFDQGITGAGLVQYSFYDEPVWGHNGSGIHGHTSAWVYRESDGVSVVVLINMDANHSQYAPNIDVINALLPAL